MKTDRRTKLLYLASGFVVLTTVIALVLFARPAPEPLPNPPEKPKEEALPEKYRETVAELEEFQMTVPVGWARIESREVPNSRVSLFLRGPIFEGQNLIIAVQTMPVQKATTLDGFVDSFTADWPMHEFPMDRNIRFCNQDARMVGFTNEDGDNLVIMFVHDGTGYVIVSLAPEAKMPQCWQIFHDVLRGFQLYE